MPVEEKRDRERKERKKGGKKGSVVEELRRVSEGTERKKALQSGLYRGLCIEHCAVQPLPMGSGSNRFHLFRVSRAARSRFDNETSYRRKCKPE